MKRVVPDVEQTRYLRRKSVLKTIFIIGAILLGGALYRFKQVGMPGEWLAVIYVGVGSALLAGSGVLFLTGWVFEGGGEEER